MIATMSLERDANPIRVLVADDHRVLRQVITEVLEQQPDLEVVGEAEDGEDAVEQVERLHPDVVLMDVSMPRISGIEATRRIVAQAPDVRVIGLSSHDRDMARTLLEAGAVGYASKDAFPEELVAIIREAV